MRTIFISADLNLKNLVTLTDTLVDSEFCLYKIEEYDFYDARDNCTWVYFLTDDNFIEFDTFLRTNYKRTKEILSSRFPPLLEE